MLFERFLFRKYLDREERLLYAIHVHWVTVQHQMIKIAIFGYLIPLLILIFFTGFSGPVSTVFYVWLFVAACYSFYVFLDWYLDAWLLTDVSIIDTAWDGFFKQRSSRIEYGSIEAINVETKGIAQSLFNFGDIVLVRASGINITLPSVSNPQFASSWISKIQSEINAAKNTHNAESIKNLLAEIIQEHIKVNS